MRKHLESLIHKSVQITPSVSPDECHAYAAETLLPGNEDKEATSEDYFRFNICDTPRSPWNKSAARVFADLTIRQLGLSNTVEMFDALRHAFTSHLGTIIRRYKMSLMSRPQQAKKAATHRREVRKYEV